MSMIELEKNYLLQISGTTRIKTANTLVGKDIVVSPKNENLVVYENGKYTPDDGFAGFSSVTVNVESSGGDADKYFEGGYAEVILPNATRIKNYAFYTDTTITNFVAPNATYIGYNTFNGCNKLAITELSDKVTIINGYAFYGCSELALTKLPANLESIYSNAFENCPKVSIKEIPKSVSQISARAFANCTGLTTITFKGKPQIVASGTFSGCTNLTAINVPWERNAVSNAPWGASSESIINYNYAGD